MTKCDKCGREINSGIPHGIRINGKDLVLDFECLKKLEKSLNKNDRIKRKITRITTVLYSPNLEKKLVQCYDVFTKYGFTKEFYFRTTPMEKGFQVVAWHGIGYCKKDLLKIREQAGDDKRRISYDRHKFYQELPDKIHERVIENGKEKIISGKAGPWIKEEDALNFIMMLKEKIKTCDEIKKANTTTKKLKLEIELIPAPLWGCSLREKLSNNDWFKIKNEIVQIRGKKCEICGKESEKIHLHEIWEYDDVELTQKLIGFKLLCPMCHHVKHLGHTGSLVKAGKLNYNEVIKHFCKVNKCSVEEFKSNKKKAFELWGNRSMHKWTQYLDDGILGLPDRKNHGMIQVSLGGKKKRKLKNGETCEPYDSNNDVEVQGSEENVKISFWET